MKNKRSILALVLALLMVLGSMSTALAAYCMSCGTQLPDGAKFCFNCGEKQDGSSTTTTTTNTYSSLSITEATENMDGSVTIRWTDSGNNSPYTVRYEFVNQAPNPFHWTSDDNVRTKSYTYAWLVPGVDYVFTVEDCNGNEAEYTYYASRPYIYNEIGSKMTLSTRIKDGNYAEDLTRLSSGDISRNLGKCSYGLYLSLSYSRLARPRSYSYKFCLTAPNGYAEAIWGGTLELSAGRSYLSPWNYVPLDDFFNTLIEFYEEIPVGDYTFSLHYDNVQVLTETFYVGR